MSSSTPDGPAPRRDDGLDWLREIRRKLTAAEGHDQTRIGDAIRAREAEVRHRLVRTQPRVVGIEPAK